VNVSSSVPLGNKRGMSVAQLSNRPEAVRRRRVWVALLTREWLVSRTTARQRRIIHYWLTILWLSVGLFLWIVLRHALWFVGFMSLYAIWITHLAGWAAETPVEAEALDNEEATHG
jgi:hypothetical protein